MGFLKGLSDYIVNYKSETTKLLEDSWVQYEFEKYRCLFPDESYQKAKRKFFTPETLIKMRKLAKEHAEFEYRKKREETAELIHARTKAYEYEEFLYSTFAPFAEKICNDYFVQESVSKGYMLSKIMECAQFRDKDPYDVLQFLEKEGLVFRSDRKEGTVYSLGRVLESYGDIISPYDMTLNKWMVQYNKKGEE